MSVGVPVRWLHLLLAPLVFSGAFLPSTGVFADSEDDEEDERGPDDSGHGSAADSVNVSSEDAASHALDHLGSTFGPANYTIQRLELKDEDYEVRATDGVRRFELKVDGETGAIVESKAKDGAEDDDDDDDTAVPPSVNASRAIEVAKQILAEQFGARNYSVTKLEFHDGRFEIELVDDQRGHFKVELNAAGDRLLKLEGKTPDLRLGIERDDEDALNLDLKEKKPEDAKKGFKVTVGKNDPKLKLEFEARENVTQSELDLELRFERLVEYLDNGTAPNILDSNDTVISAVNLDALRWSAARSETLGSNASITGVTLTQTGSGRRVENITFTYHLAPTSRTISVDNETVANVKIWEVKFDIHIQGFNWTTPESSLTLVGRFNTEFEVEVEEDKEIQFKEKDGITPFFNWGGAALADGASVDVHAEVQKSRLTLSYSHFNDTLIHDPTIGYILPTTLPSLELLVPALMALGGILLATTVAAVGIMRSRKLRGAIITVPGGTST